MEEPASRLELVFEYAKDDGAIPTVANAVDESIRSDNDFIVEANLTGVNCKTPTK